MTGPRRPLLRSLGIAMAREGAILGWMPDGGSTGRSIRLSWLGGLAAFLGGAAWTVKGVVILVGGDQPPLLFEIAPVLFGVGLLGVAFTTMPGSHRRTVALGLATAAALAALVALVIDLGGEFNPALVVSSLALLVGLLTLPRHAAWPAPLAWWIGVAQVPALLVGGLLSDVDERLLEVPLTCLGIAWMTVGWALLRKPAVDSTRASVDPRPG